MARLRKNHRLKGGLKAVCLSGLLSTSLSMPARSQSDYNPQQEFLRAIEHEDLEGLQIYEAEGADVNALDSFDQSPLIKAVFLGNVYVIRELIKLGALIVDPRVSHQAMPALHEAARMGRLGVMDVLLKAGAKLEDTSAHGSTALWEAVYAGNPAAVRWLISQGSDANGKTLQLNGKVKPLLIQAAHLGELEIVEALLDAGADPKVSFLGWTPLMHAAVNGHLEVVKCLIKRGQSPEAATEAGWTPAMAAAAGGHTHVLEFLVSQGIVLKGRPGWKAVIEAVYSIQPSIPSDRRAAVRYLLSQGAIYDAKIQKIPGTTELEIAKASGVKEWILKLQPHHQSPDTFDTEETISPSAQPTITSLMQSGELLLLRGLLTLARDNYNLAITLYPRHIEAHIRLAWVYLQLSEFTRARQSAEQAVALNPTLPRAHMLLAHAQLFAGQTEAALIEYQHILASSGRLRAEYVRILKQDFKDLDEQGLVPQALERVQALF